jgi:hypothetical protein
VTVLLANVIIGTTRADVLWTAYAGRHTTDDVRIMCRRLQHFGGTPSAEARALLAPVEPAQVTVLLTRAQVDRLDAQMPPSLTEQLLATRVRATAADLRDMASMLDVSAAIDLVTGGIMRDLSSSQTLFIAERVILSVETLRQKLLAGARRADALTARNL